MTLYFNQSDFTDYNSSNGSDPDLPKSSNDFAGKANLRIVQEYGTSSTGKLGSYISTGTARFEVMNPVDSEIIWNNRLNRWEITVDVKGFGGFFAYGENAPTRIDGVRNSSPLLVSPIPATSELLISVVDSKFLGETVSISDIQGRLIKRFQLEKKTKLNVEQWAAGVYFLHLPDAEVIKVVKQ